MLFSKYSRLLLVLFLVPTFFLLFSAPNNAAACSRGIGDHVMAVATTYSNYRFVYLKPTDVIDKSIRQQYPKSGLYSADDSRKLIWELTDKWQPDNEAALYATSDGKYLIKRDGTFLGGSITFYKEGRYVKEYFRTFFEDAPPTLSPHLQCFYEWFSQETFDEKTGRFYFRAANQKTYTFDIYTGNFLGVTPVSSPTASVTTGSLAEAVSPEKIPVSPDNSNNLWIIITAGAILWFIGGAGLLAIWRLKISSQREKRD